MKRSDLIFYEFNLFDTVVSAIQIFNKVHDFFYTSWLNVRTDFNDMEAQYTDEINEAVSMWLPCKELCLISLWIQ